MVLLKMNRRKIGIFLVIYGLCGGLVLDFVNYMNYLNMENLKYLLIMIFHPLALFLPFTTTTSLIMGMYPFAVIAVGFYLVLSLRKR